jgi:hypothetical protein
MMCNFPLFLDLCRHSCKSFHIRFATRAASSYRRGAAPAVAVVEWNGEAAGSKSTRHLWTLLMIVDHVTGATPTRQN